MTDSSLAPRRERPVGDYVHDRLFPEDLASLRAWMAEAQQEDELSEAYCNLSNAGYSVPGEPPFTERHLRMMLEILAAARQEPQTRPVDWECLLSGAFRERADAVGQLFDEASAAVKILPFPVGGRR
ncbi:hypothetical protein [Methylobacterium sp. 1030]|uniref:hypothetical protein n=1 Tax=Methylobacterium sp. 1030 TaxID=3156404 RepID=UPI003397115C